MGRPLLDIEGQKYGLLTAVKRVESPDKNTRWLFRCDCGNEVTRPSNSVRQGGLRSCGCLRAEATGRRSTRHGHRIGGKSSPTIMAYERAKTLCDTPSAHGYRKVGGRGLGMCDRWRSGFEHFLADMGERPDEHRLVRVDPDKGFEPGNCKWVLSTRKNAG